MSIKIRFRTIRIVFVACFSCLALSGCPIPIPVCEDRAFLKPGIDVKEPHGDLKEIPEGSALVFGRFVLGPLEKQGLISVRLVRYESQFMSGEMPYAAEELWLEQDGRFLWLLPEGHYAIQPLYFNHAYDGQSYSEAEELNVSVEFTASGNHEPIYLGDLDIVLSTGFEIETVTVDNRYKTARIDLPAWNFARDPPIATQLMRHNPELPPQVVPHRDVCRRWSPICWGILFPYGGCFNAEN